jgi:CO/xanthine dehydrogenase Mo-binding subunit
VTIVTKNHIGEVLILKAEYAGQQLVPPNQAITEVSFTVKKDRNSLKLVCVFSASINGVGELRESAPPDSQLLRPLSGDVNAAIAGAAKKVEAVYAYPFQNHAPMEPMNATAKYTADRCEVWAPTQNGEAAFAATIAQLSSP